MFGMIGLVLIVMFETITINNDSSYYILKEAMQAAMYESIDYAYWSNNRVEEDVNGKKRVRGEIKIIEQKFVENFTRRFAASINDNANNYTLEFYDIIEKPPKATVAIKSNTTTYKGGSSDIIVQDEVDIDNALTGILEVYD